MSYESKKGYAAEHAIRMYLRDVAPDCYRPRAGGTADVGDIEGLPIVVSVKNHRALNLAGWVTDLTRMLLASKKTVGVVWHKRSGRAHPRDWYVTMTGATFMDLLRVYVRQNDVNPSLSSDGDRA
jgi:hypothetical protein